MEYCIHGEPLLETLEGHPHQKELEDPNDLGIMEFYQTCDCCYYPMHNESPGDGKGVMQEDDSILCSRCNEGEKLLEKSKRFVKSA